MGLGQFGVYWIDEGKSSSKKKILSDTANKALLYLGYACCLCLSVVGAVCDDEKLESCRGNNTIHSTSAVIFFVGYDIMMAIVARNKGATSTESVLFALALMTKLRFSPSMLRGLGVPSDETPLAIFEWSNVSVIMYWTYHTFHVRGKDLSIALLDQDSLPTASPFSVLTSFSATFVATTSVSLCLGTLSSTLLFALHQGRVPTGHVPYISDLWVYPPGDWVSRWALVAGATLVSFDSVCVYYMRSGNNSGTKTREAGRAALAIVSMLGLSVVGCINESENIHYHSAAAVVFFVGYDLYMISTVAGVFSTRSSNNSNGSNMLLAVLCVASLASKARFMAVEGLPSNLPAMLEWTDAIAIISFYGVMMNSLDTKHTYSLSLLYEPSADVEEKDEPLLAHGAISLTGQ
jgi:hypothetical membrane protein